MAFIVQGAIKGIATGIGLASEGYQHHQEKKKHANDPTIIINEKDLHENIAENTTTHDISPKERHEAVWELDEAAATQDSPNEEDGTQSSDYDHKEGTGIEKPSKVVAAFIQRHPHSNSSLSEHGEAHLLLPVVIPQRRPEARSRGFVRAYAPLLEHTGIDETTFLEFIHDLNVICLPDPKIAAINLASFATMALPTITGMIVSQIINKISQAAEEVHSRSKMNEYLGLMNQQFFKPRRLFCLIMTWQPNNPNFFATHDLSRTISQEATSPGPQSRLDKTAHAMRVSSGQSYDFEMPETAPLIFPGLDSLATYNPKDPEGKKTMSKLKSGKRFVDEYMDKRAHAKWAGANMDSQVAHTVKTSFSSRYADPNHPAASGDLLALITAGNLSRPNLLRGGGRFGGGYGGRFGRGFGRGTDGMGRPLGIRGVLDQRADLFHSRGFGGRWGGRGYQDDAAMQQYPGDYGSSRSGGQQRGYGGLMGMSPIGLVLGGATNLLQKNILYLMIVNLPTDEELAEAAKLG